MSLGYLSEVERGQKEASSELLASICDALGVRMSDLLRDVSESLALVEAVPATNVLPLEPITVADVGSASGLGAVAAA